MSEGNVGRGADEIEGDEVEAAADTTQPSNVDVSNLTDATDSSHDATGVTAPSARGQTVRTYVGYSIDDGELQRPVSPDVRSVGRRESAPGRLEHLRYDPFNYEVEVSSSMVTSTKPGTDMML